MSEALPLDEAWLAAHPLPVTDPGIDKNGRGRVLAAGGAMHVPGALRLTGEAAFRAGAGKVQLATVEPAALLLGMHVPEAAAIPLPMDAGGEIAVAAVPLLREAIERCDAFVLGPGMGDAAGAAELVEALLDTPRADLAILLDAAAIACADRFRELLCRHDGRLVLTPHHGEMAKLTGLDADAIAADPDRAARDVAERCGTVVALKSGRTLIAGPDGTLLRYAGGGVGLATGGSGDVLAGVIAGLLARGASALVATAWGVWLHGEAGRRLAGRIGTTGFLARELLAEIPGLMDRPAP
ncbi:NAD(P)H-hydrate dehydratase [Sphingomonas profundi]|uniref:NAD(P)H-hydrate dehydratase n=1 Tax=Alterirhizorhabdus profundi TaxID=2681549 RepID=UPI0012E88E68|nr:NAD(P)H-hydrate dehydratase [Sphingomonas profundi]